jgi:netrin-G3 ligand
MLIYVNLFSVPTGAPQNFTAIGISPTSVRLQWDPPDKKHRNGEIIFYEVMYHQQKQRTDDLTTNTTETYVIVEGLQPVTDYNFKIRAYTAIGPGPWSNRLPFRPFAQRKKKSSVFRVRLGISS